MTYVYIKLVLQILQKNLKNPENQYRKLHLDSVHSGDER